MNDPPIRTSFDVFRATRRELKSGTAHADTLRANAMFGVGVLLGGGFPGASAAISLLLEREFGDEPWPWGDDLIDPSDEVGDPPAFLKPRSEPRD
jgi:hypothetical protein